MRKGTTPTLVFTLDLETALLKSIYLTLQQGTLQVTKTGEEMRLLEDGCSVAVTLTQEETLQFVAGQFVSVQVRAVTQNGEAVATNILDVPMEAVLLDGVIT